MKKRILSSVGIAIISVIIFIPFDYALANPNVSYTQQVVMGAVIFVLVFITCWFLDRTRHAVAKPKNDDKENEKADSKDKKDTGSDGLCSNDKHCEGCKDYGGYGDDLYCHSKVHCSKCPPVWRCKNYSHVKQ